MVPKMRRIFVLSLLVTGASLGHAILSRAQDAGAYKLGVVKVLSQTEGSQPRTGSGFIVALASEVAFIVTAAHVVEGDPTPRVEFFARPGTLVKTKVDRLEGGDPRGLALLKVTGRGLVPPESIALAIDPKVPVTAAGDVTVIGFPRGGSSWAVSKASVNGLDGRDMVLSGSMDEGSSGGPVIKDGRVVGMVASVLGQFTRAVPAAVIQITLQGWQVQTEVDQSLMAAQEPETEGLPASIRQARLAFDGRIRLADESRIYTIAGDGSGRITLFGTKDQQVLIDACDGRRAIATMDPAWSPDGTRVAFSGLVRQRTDHSCCGNYQIFVGDANGRKIRRLTTGDAWERHPTWSPDGNHVAYESKAQHGDDRGAHIYLIDSDGGEQKRVTLATNRKSRAETQPSWSHDGTTIAYVSEQEDGDVICLFWLQTAKERCLTKPTFYLGRPAWSVDDKRLAFALSLAKGGKQDIYILDLTSLRLVRLTDSRDSKWSASPAWSPDGKWIAYASGGRTGGQIFISRTDGSNVAAISEHIGELGGVVWQPLTGER